MALVDLIMPKMGESIMEATILKWNKKIGENVAADEPVLDIATDKVDSEVPSTVAGTLAEILFKEGDVVPVGKAIARIETSSKSVENIATKSEIVVQNIEKEIEKVQQIVQPSAAKSDISNTGRFYSPLVLNIAKQEGISMQELEKVAGTGQDERVTKKDILSYIANRDQKVNNPQSESKSVQQVSSQPEEKKPEVHAAQHTPQITKREGENIEIIEMDRMRKLIADHMVMSKKVSPHVTSFVEADVTNIVLWRNKAKGVFEKREGEKLTFTPIFIEAVVKALKEYPKVNASVNGYEIWVRKDINIGMATALPSGNLIVPVIKNADGKNLVGICKNVNELAERARKNALKPHEIEGGTFTLTNVGTFGNLMGTPIINQPQVAILATGAIKKKPVVLETPQGDVIAIRHMMYLSLSYDHRIVDGAMGGAFLRRVADLLEQFDVNREI